MRANYHIKHLLIVFSQLQFIENLSHGIRNQNNGEEGIRAVG